MNSRIVLFACVLLAGVRVSAAFAQRPVRYLVRVMDPGSQLYHVEATFPATGDTTLLSLPAWTPGHYEIENYARYVRDFTARSGERELDWDKLDKDTWRVGTSGAGDLTVSFDYLADTTDLSLSVLRKDFGFFNGTNLFLFPEGADAYAAELRLELPAGWRVATELEETARPFVYRAADYDELVDNPTFIGSFAIDSVQVDGVWVRLAVYPAGYLRDPAGKMALDALAKIAKVCNGMFGGPPYDRYTTFVLLKEEATFLAGLEHAASQVDVMPAFMFEQPRFTFRGILFRLLSHEFFHAWNVKRIRPAELWPYDYAREQPTPLLWVSEGITDYYAHVVLARAGLWGENEFWFAVREAIGSLMRQPARVAVEDASVNTWMETAQGDRYIYYDEGALLGLLLDIEIRNATANAASLDDVMRSLFRERYERGRGFTTADFFRYVSGYLGPGATRTFYESYIDGRRPLPLRETLALAGMSYAADTINEPYLGVAAGRAREGQISVREVEPGTAADRAGLRPGDELVQVGSVAVEGPDWSDRFREAYAGQAGTEITITFRRGGESLSAVMPIGSRTRYEHHLTPSEPASERQLAIRRAIVEGTPRDSAGGGP